MIVKPKQKSKAVNGIPQFELVGIHDQFGVGLRIGWRPNRKSRITHAAQPIKFKEFDGHSVLHADEPPPIALKFEREELQQLLDEIWRFGVRPSPQLIAAQQLAEAERSRRILEEMGKATSDPEATDGEAAPDA